MKRIFIFILMALIIFFIKNSIKEVYVSNENGSFKTISYIETIESYSPWDGKIILKKSVSYVYPDKLRVDYLDELNSVEIINGDKYFYTNNNIDHIIVRWTIPVLDIDIFDIFKMIEGKEIIGYEVKNDVQYRIIGIKNKVDDVQYLTKVWIGDYKGFLLPYKVEYFISNKIVTQRIFEYQSIDDKIDLHSFTLSSLGSKKLLFDGSEPVYLNFNRAKKFLNFEPLIYKNNGYNLSETKLIREEGKNILNLVYIKGDVIIEVFERKKESKDSLLSIKNDGDKIYVDFIEGDIFISVVGAIENYVDIIDFCSGLSDKLNFEKIDGEYRDGQDDI
ncbi:MAG: hypothetical protein N2486_09645 [Caloramator sp.]|nr:hypothetical protein [Caloramator sp.]